MSGTIAKLWRYPVKSMLGEACETLELEARGVAGDRLYAVRDAEGKLGSGKNSRRHRRIEGLLGFRAASEGAAPRITFPDGRSLLANDPGIHAALSAALGLPVTLSVEADLSHHDSGPLHLVTTGSLAGLKRTLPRAGIDERRFRPNLVIEGEGENSWVGRTLQVGDEVRLKVVDWTGALRDDHHGPVRTGRRAAHPARRRAGRSRGAVRRVCRGARSRPHPPRRRSFCLVKDTAERYVILQGRGRVEVGDLPPQDVGPGDVVLIPPSARQRIANSGKEDLVFLAICTPRFRSEAYEDLQ